MSVAAALLLTVAAPPSAWQEAESADAALDLAISLPADRAERIRYFERWLSGTDLTPAGKRIVAEIQADEMFKIQQQQEARMTLLKAVDAAARTRPFDLAPMIRALEALDRADRAFVDTRSSTAIRVLRALSPADQAVFARDTYGRAYPLGEAWPDKSTPDAEGMAQDD